MYVSSSLVVTVSTTIQRCHWDFWWHLFIVGLKAFAEIWAENSYTGHFVGRYPGPRSFLYRENARVLSDFWVQNVRLSDILVSRPNQFFFICVVCIPSTATAHILYLTICEIEWHFGLRTQSNVSSLSLKCLLSLSDAIQKDTPATVQKQPIVQKNYCSIFFLCLENN